MFIPFDEAYYQAMASLIDRRFVNWQEQAYDEDTLEASISTSHDEISRL